MGKADDELPTSALPASSAPGAPGGNAGAGRCCCCGRHRLWLGRIVGSRCILTLVVGFAVLISALFWLPPFLRHSGDTADRDRKYGADIIASFRLQRPVNLLYDNIAKLQYDILDEIEVPGSLVHVIYLEPLARSNWTNVVFGVLPYKSSHLSSTSLSILRSSFVSLVMQQSTLKLTTSLFGNASFFQFLKFIGGITIVPQQNGFPLQKDQMLFNFTLNFPIYQVQDKIGELKDQMKSGLLLNYNENLFVRLTNLEGSTVNSPTIVQTSVLLAVGNRQPSLPRLKQLAENIRNSSAGNLGLNHTVFGRVKQIRLSSYLQHSLNSEGSSSPSPSPQPQSDHRDHHHHQHHHHHHSHHHYRHHGRYYGASLAPSLTPAPAPAPPKDDAKSPTSCSQHKYSNKPRHSAYLPPSAAPMTSPKSSFSPAASPLHLASPFNAPKGYASPVDAPEHSVAPSAYPEHLLAPRKHVSPPVLAPDTYTRSPFPNVYFTHTQPPIGSVDDNKPPIMMPSSAPSTYTSSFASGNNPLCWIFVLLFYALARL